MLHALHTLREGQCAVVAALSSAEHIRRRLRDLGLIEGTAIQCLQKSRTGDPTAYLIRGTVIALRTADAAQILVREASDPWD